MNRTAKEEMEYQMAKAEREHKQFLKDLEKPRPWLKQIPHTMHYPREHYFRGLSALDIDNLKCGRITRQTMAEAFKRVDVTSADSTSHAYMLLADELNDMLSAAK